jgi:hypothetical protein
MSPAFRRVLAVCASLASAALVTSQPTWGQSGMAQSSPPASQAELDAKIQALSESLDETRAELSQSRDEIKELRSMLAQVVEKMGANGVSVPVSEAQPPIETNATTNQPGSEQEVAHITPDDWQIANARIEEQAQDKVESNLKYRVKLSGIVLLNAFSVSGQVDNLDVPTVALPHEPEDPSGSVGASLRQSIIGLTGIGPRIFGAETFGDVQMDFFGGLPGGYASTTSGIMRLRVARLRMDWANTSLFGGIDTPFFSPNLPSSYMSVAVPGFAAAGNLWIWTPTIGVEQRVDAGKAQLKIQAGFMDPSTYAGANATVRLSTPTESSRQPTYALRVSANGKDERRPVSFGVSGIYSPQRFQGGTTLSGWGSVADWRFALFPHAEVSGEAFVGRGIDAFGGVPTPVPVLGGYNYYAVALPALERITIAGGWTQLKIKLDAKNEFNFALGSGGRDSGEFRQVQPLDPAFSTLSPRNEMLFVNYIFRPRSDLVLSPEFRRLRTYPGSGSASIADQVGVAAGFIF